MTWKKPRGKQIFESVPIGKICKKLENTSKIKSVFDFLTKKQFFINTTELFQILKLQNNPKYI